jgi:hypothetical protein
VVVVFVLVGVVVAGALAFACVYGIQLASGERRYAEAQPGSSSPPSSWHPTITLPVTAIVAGVRAGRSAQMQADARRIRVSSDAVSPVWIARDEVQSIRRGRGLRSGMLIFEVPGRDLRSTWIWPRGADVVEVLSKLGWPIDV